MYEPEATNLNIQPDQRGREWNNQPLQ